MNPFPYDNQQLMIEQLPAHQLAQQFGTPTYVYSRKAIEHAYRRYIQAFSTIPHRIHYSVKANSSLGILSVLCDMGAGFDVVSAGELTRVLHVGAQANQVVFSGVGKSREDIELALNVGIHCFNVESESELNRIEAMAKSFGIRAPIALRVNPNIDALTHPHVSTGLSRHKFGIPIQEALDLYKKAANSPWLNIVGLDCHIGSQITTLQPFTEATAKMISLVDALLAENIVISHLNIGGGLGIVYQEEAPLSIEDYAQAILHQLNHNDIQLFIEPGRSIVAHAGLLLCQVEYLKHTSSHHFAIVNAGMNDLLRPALYQAWQDIVPLKHNPQATPYVFDVVGPVCESVDCLGQQRHLAIQEGDYLAICGAGAYGSSMSSRYNSRPLAAEVLVDGDTARLIRHRETLEDLFAQELLP